MLLLRLLWHLPSLLLMVVAAARLQSGSGSRLQRSSLLLMLPQQLLLLLLLVITACRAQALRLSSTQLHCCWRRVMSGRMTCC